MFVGCSNRTEAFKETPKSNFYERVSPVLAQEALRRERRYRIFQHSHIDLKHGNKDPVARPRASRPGTPTVQASRLK